MQSLTEKNKKPFVVLISGKARNGKDTLADFIKKYYQNSKKENVLILHYADYLKYLCKQFYNWNGEKDEIGRTLLQQTGESYRKKDVDFWVKQVCSLIEMESDNYDLFIIPDVRYPNEIERVKEIADTISIRVERTNFENDLTNNQKNHLSEISLDKYEFDLIVKNEGALGELEQKVRPICHEIEIKRGNTNRVI